MKEKMARVFKDVANGPGCLSANEKLCGEFSCEELVDRSRDENSVHCSRHTELRKCGVESCTFVVDRSFHANTKYCNFCSSSVCSFKGCFRVLSAHLQDDYDATTSTLLRFCAKHDEGSAQVGSATTTGGRVKGLKEYLWTTHRGRSKANCEHEACRKVAVGTTAFCAEHGRQCPAREWDSSGKFYLVGTCGRQPAGKKDAFCSLHNFHDAKVCSNSGCGNQIYEYAWNNTCKSCYNRRLCGHAGCDLFAVSGGEVGRCSAHGGGKRRQYDNCEKQARGKTGFCVGHGGAWWETVQN
jgi:hypothetical protein